MRANRYFSALSAVAGGRRPTAHYSSHQ